MSNIRYASIRELDISNGEGIGAALFVQGCPFNPHCYNCFNPDTWDFNGGKEWTSETENKLIELASKPYIKRLSILGGEPLADENLEGVLHLVNEFRLSFPQKTIWIYSGYTWNEVMNSEKRKQIVSQCTVMVDGRYIDSKRDITLKWCGSSNQKVILVKESLEKGEIVLWTDQYIE